MQIVLKNDLSELARLASELERFGQENDLPHAVVLELNLALDELVTNTISYGFSTGQRQDAIQVDLERSDAAIEIVVTDSGKPYNPFETPEPDLTADLEDRPIGGLGVFLVRQIMDDCHYERVSGRNRVRLRKHLTLSRDEP